jgi:hypothetical protein
MVVLAYAKKGALLYRYIGLNAKRRKWSLVLVFYFNYMIFEALLHDL